MASTTALINDSLGAFAVFARHMNFTHAADELHIAQPSLHTKINKLGNALGAELYVREGRTLRLTPQGEALRQFAVESTKHAEDFVAALIGQPSRISIAAGRGMLRWVLSETLRDALRMGLQVEVSEASREEALSALDDGTADVAGVAADPPPSHLDFVEVARVAQVALVSKRHPLASSTSVGMSDLAGEPLIVPTSARPHRQQLERAALASGSALRVSVEVDGWDLLTHMASLGLGIAIVNELAPSPKGLVAVPVTDLPTVGYWLAWRPERAAPATLLSELRQ